MQAIDKTKVDLALKSFQGRRAFLHAEAIPGGFLRNIVVDILQTFIAGDGPSYRVAMKIEHGGWIRMESITHYESPSQDRLLLAGHDDQGRLFTVLELSLKPFEFGEEA
jgi:hypothetical protein